MDDPNFVPNANTKMEITGCIWAAVSGETPDEFVDEEIRIAADKINDIIEASYAPTQRDDEMNLHIVFKTESEILYIAEFEDLEEGLSFIKRMIAKGW